MHGRAALQSIPPRPSLSPPKRGLLEDNRGGLSLAYRNLTPNLSYHRIRVGLRIFLSSASAGGGCSSSFACSLRLTSLVFLGRGKTAECGAYWTAITPGGKLLFSRGDGHQLNVVVADDVWLSLRSCPANANLENLAGRWRFCYVNPARCTIGNDLDRKTCRRAGR